MQVSKQVLRTVLGSAGTRYEIPLYQRTYDWSQAQFSKLWEDLESLVELRRADPSAEHFMGTLVLASGHNSPNDFTFLVVDGQQRLTTLTILLIALRDALRKQREGTDDADELADEVLVHRYKKTHPERFRLWPTHGDRKTFIELINGEQAEFNESNLAKAYSFFKQKLDESALTSVNMSINEVRSATLDGLRFVSITAEQSDNVYAIFESLNNTGLKLTQGDLLRNFYFSRLGNLAQEVHESFWFPMQERLSRDDLTHLFWLDLTLRNSEVKKDATFKEQSKAAATLTPEELRGEVKRFSQLAILLEAMRHPSKESDHRVRRSLQRLIDFGIESIDPLVLGIMRARFDGALSNEQAIETFNVLESFLVRRLIIRAPHNALSRILMRAFGAIDLEDPAGSLRLYFSKDNKDFASDDEIRVAATSVNFYRSGTTRQRKTLLSWLEEILAGNEPAGLAKATIEHVLPQHLTSAWINELNGDLGDFSSPEAVHETYVHTLANITLSGYNSKMSNRPFLDKKKLLTEKSNIELNKWIAGRDSWTRSDILERGEYIADLIASNWVPPVSVGLVIPSALEEARLARAVAEVPAGRWTTIGELSDHLESSPIEVSKLLRSKEIEFAWRVMDATGQHADQLAEPASARALTNRLLDEGVQLDASGRALRSQYWSYSESSNLAGSGLEADSSDLSGPVREFLNSAANRLPEPMSNALHSTLSDWASLGGRILIGADQTDAGTLTAILEEEGEENGHALELGLTAANGLLVRRKGEPHFSVAEKVSDFDRSALFPDATP